MYFDGFYSDPHFFHENIIKYCNRPYKDSFHMNEMMIENYNKIVRKYDTILWLGDCFFTKNNDSRKNIMSRLNGKKILLRGNHDDKISDIMLYDLGFSSVFNTHFLSEIDDHIVRFSHYPHFSDDIDSDKRHKDRRPPIECGVTLIHGHTHEKNKITNKNHIHVGVDAWEYAPAPYDEVAKLLNTLK